MKSHPGISQGKREGLMEEYCRVFLETGFACKQGGTGPSKGFGRSQHLSSESHLVHAGNSVQGAGMCGSLKRIQFLFAASSPVLMSLCTCSLHPSPLVRGRAGLLGWHQWAPLSYVGVCVDSHSRKYLPKIVGQKIVRS